MRIFSQNYWLSNIPAIDFICLFGDLFVHKAFLFKKKMVFKMELVVNCFIQFGKIARHSFRRSFDRCIYIII